MNIITEMKNKNVTALLKCCPHLTWTFYSKRKITQYNCLKGVYLLTVRNMDNDWEDAVYVGKSVDLLGRISSHKVENIRAALPHSYKLAVFYALTENTYSDETKLIQTLDPILNKQNKPLTYNP